MDKFSQQIQEGLRAFQLPYTFSSQVTPADGDCYAHALLNQLQMSEHWNSVLPRGRISDINVFKRQIVHFIKTDVQLQQDDFFQSIKVAMIEDLIVRQRDEYGCLDPEQAFMKYLDNYANKRGVYAEFIIVYATPFFCKNLCILLNIKAENNSHQISQENSQPKDR